MALNCASDTAEPPAAAVWKRDDSVATSSGLSAWPDSTVASSRLSEMREPRRTAAAAALILRRALKRRRLSSVAGKCEVVVLDATHGCASTPRMSSRRVSSTTSRRATRSLAAGEMADQVSAWNSYTPARIWRYISSWRSA